MEDASGEAEQLARELAESPVDQIKQPNAGFCLAVWLYNNQEKVGKGTFDFSPFWKDQQPVSLPHDVQLPSRIPTFQDKKDFDHWERFYERYVDGVVAAFHKVANADELPVHEVLLRDITMPSPTFVTSLAAVDLGLSEFEWALKSAGIEDVVTLLEHNLLQPGESFSVPREKSVLPPGIFISETGSFDAQFDRHAGAMGVLNRFLSNMVGLNPQEYIAKDTELTLGSLDEAQAVMSQRTEGKHMGEPFPFKLSSCYFFSLPFVSDATNRIESLQFIVVDRLALQHIDPRLGMFSEMYLHEGLAEMYNVVGPCKPETFYFLVVEEDGSPTILQPHIDPASDWLNLGKWSSEPARQDVKTTSAGAKAE